MRVLLVIGVLLALVAPLCAETYSWLDDSGTFHFTEDYSRIPKKYRNKVSRRGDMSSVQAPATDTPEKTGAGGSPKADASGGKAAANSGGSNSKQLFGGKTEDAWRSDAALQEQELIRLEGSLETLRKQTLTPGISREHFAELKKEYDETRATYNQKYEIYSKLLESAKKAGLQVEMKK
jgi:hypothetical protein